MNPVIDLTKEYSLVLEGGGARGAYQIGAWKALQEAGIRINAVAGTSVGALNGALICMEDYHLAEELWRNLTASSVMDMNDDWIERLFNGEISIPKVIAEVYKRLSDGGIDVTPLRNLINEKVDEEKIRRSKVKLYLLTYSLSDKRELDLGLDEIPSGQLSDYLMASAYLWGFKREPLHGKHYMDGGIFNNVPLKSLIDRGYKEMIGIRIYGPGREPKVKLPKGVTVYEIAPRVGLGSILEFRAKRSIQNMIIGYFDAKRLIYGLIGQIYYIEQTHEEWYYEEKLSVMTEVEKAEAAFVLKIGLNSSDMELYLSMLEAGAKLLRVPKYTLYTVDELKAVVSERYTAYKSKKELPQFVHHFMRLGKEEI